MTVSATLKGSKDPLGRRKVYIRVSDKGKRRFHATQMKVEDKDWDFRKSKVKSGPHADYINRKIKEVILQIESGIFTPQSDAILFKDYAYKCLNDWEHTKKEGTLIQIRSKVKKFTEFKSVFLHDITPTVLNNYVSYLYKSGLSGNSVWVCLKTVRTILHRAYKEKVIKDYPFDLFDMPKYIDKEKIFLSKEQVSKIESIDFQGELKIAATWFLISCYTGLRYSDQHSFNVNKIKNGRMVIYTNKTGQLVSIKLHDKINDLLKSIDYKPMPYTLTHYNRLLKIIAASCEIQERVTTHTGRHTCAMMLANSGVSQEVTRVILGHGSLKTTAIYYKILGGRIDLEIEKIF